MNLDVVYIARAGENEELRYSLRSLANLPVRDVWLVGGKPPWYTGKHLRVPQGGEKNIVSGRAMIAACQHPPISDPFILFNDDFYVMKPGPIPPTMHRGPIQGVLDWYAGNGITNSKYVKRMRATLVKLQRLGIENPLSYELHIPMVIDKLRMLGATTYGGQQRTMYGNLAQIGGTKTRDVKVLNEHTIPTGRWLSTVDKTYPLVAGLLAQRFPDPSPWEAPGASSAPTIRPQLSELMGSRG